MTANVNHPLNHPHTNNGTGTLPCVLADQVTSFGNFYVAQCNNFEDARLIAAAPDLLEALEEMRQMVIEFNQRQPSAINYIGGGVIHKADRAIAKAKGEQP